MVLRYAFPRSYPISALMLFPLACGGGEEDSFGMTEGTGISEASGPGSSADGSSTGSSSTDGSSGSTGATEGETGEGGEDDGGDPPPTGEHAGGITLTDVYICLLYTSDAADE